MRTLSLKSAYQNVNYDHCEVVHTLCIQVFDPSECFFEDRVTKYDTFPFLLENLLLKQK